MAISEKTYRQVALEDPTESWELSCGHLRSKPVMTNAHGYVTVLLAEALRDQIDRRVYLVRDDVLRLRTDDGSYYIPDVCVFPRALLERAVREQPEQLELYNEPMPFVAETWSPSTGNYDVQRKIPEYQRRGDLEIWLLHPYEKTVRRWIRQADSGYEETILRSGSVQLSALPNVTIDIESLFGSDTGDDDGDH